MEDLSEFRKRLQDATLDARSKDLALTTKIALLTATHERLLASHSSLLKERDVLVSKVAEGERQMLSRTRECEARVAAVNDEKAQLAKQLGEQKAVCDQLSAALAATKDELAKLQVTAALAAADQQAAVGSVQSMDTVCGPEKAVTQKAVEAFMATLRGDNEVSVLLAKETAATAQALTLKVTQLEADQATTRTEAATAMYHVQTMSALVKDLRLALESSRVQCVAAEGARAAAEATAKEAQAAQATAQASLQAKAQLIDSLQAQLTSAGEAHVRHTDMLGQATSALRTQDTALQKLRGELLALHEAVDKHDAALRAVRDAHAQEIEGKESQVQGLEQQLAMLKVELDKMQSDAGSAGKAAEATITALQAELVQARQDCALARQEVLQAVDKCSAATATMKAAALAQQEAERQARTAQAALQALVARMPEGFTAPEPSPRGGAVLAVDTAATCTLPVQATGASAPRSYPTVATTEGEMQLVPPPPSKATVPVSLPSYNSATITETTVPISGMTAQGEDGEEREDGGRQGEEEVQAEFTPPSSPVRPRVSTGAAESSTGDSSGLAGLEALHDAFGSAHAAPKHGDGPHGRFSDPRDSSNTSAAFPQAVALPLIPATAPHPGTAHVQVQVPAQPVAPIMQTPVAHLGTTVAAAKKTSKASAPAVSMPADDDIEDSRDAEGVLGTGTGVGTDLAQGPRQIVSVLPNEDEDEEDLITATAVLNALINAGKQKTSARPAAAGSASAGGKASLRTSGQGKAGRSTGAASVASTAGGKRKRPVSPQQQSDSP